MRYDLATPAAPQVSGVLPRRPQGIVFDLDGTLIDSEALVKDAYFAACEHMALPFSDEQFLGLVGRHREDSERKMREYFGPSCDLAAFYAAVSAHIGDGCAPLKPGAVELLDHLDAARLPYALATSSGPAWVAKHFAAHRLSGRFRSVVTREDVVHGKPHPEPYLKASTLLGHPPADLLAIEDSPTGVASAHAAGLMTLMIPDLIQPDDQTRARVIHVGTSLNDVRSYLDT